MPTPLLTLRLDDETKARWKAEAKKQGQSMTDYVKDAVEARISGVTARPPNPTPAVPSARRKGECPRAFTHRPGTYCSFCDSVPIQAVAESQPKAKWKK